MLQLLAPQQRGVQAAGVYSRPDGSSGRW